MLYNGVFMSHIQRAFKKQILRHIIMLILLTTFPSAIIGRVSAAACVSLTLATVVTWRLLGQLHCQPWLSDWRPIWARLDTYWTKLWVFELKSTANGSYKLPGLCQVCANLVSLILAQIWQACRQISVRTWSVLIHSTDPPNQLLPNLYVCMYVCLRMREMAL